MATHCPKHRLTGFQGSGCMAGLRKKKGARERRQAGGGGRAGAPGRGGGGAMKRAILK